MFPGRALGPCGQPWLEEGHTSFVSASVHCFPSDDMAGMWRISVQRSLVLN